jgi:hypothetical protein
LTLPHVSELMGAAVVLAPVLTVLPLELDELGPARLMAMFVDRFEIPAGGLLELI